MTHSLQVPSPQPDDVAKRERIAATLAYSSGSLWSSMLSALPYALPHPPDLAAVALAATTKLVTQASDALTAVIAIDSATATTTNSALAADIALRQALRALDRAQAVLRIAQR